MKVRSKKLLNVLQQKKKHKSAANSKFHRLRAATSNGIFILLVFSKICFSSWG